MLAQRLCPCLGQSLHPQKALTVLGVGVHTGLWLCAGVGDQAGVGCPWFALTAWGLVTWSPGTLGLGSGEEAPLRRSFLHILTADIWNLQYCIALLPTRAQCGFHRDYGCKQLHVQVWGWCPRLICVLVWLHVWPPLLPSTRWCVFHAKTPLALEYPEQ